MSVGTTLKQVSERIWAGTPSLEVLKAGLDGVLKTCSSGKSLCPWQGGQNKIVFKVTFNPNHSVIL